MKNWSDQETSPSRVGGAPQRNTDEMRDVIAYDSETDTYRISYDGAEPISMTIISTVAAVSDTDSRDSPPLYAAIDPDALNDLVSTANGDELQITFTYSGYHIEVDGNGHIAMTEVDD